MILISAEPALAREIGAFITSQKAYAIRADSARELLAVVQAARPTCVILDAGIGGDRWRALEAVPSLIETVNHPKVIVLVPKLTRRVEKEAYRWGCDDVIDLGARTWCRDLSHSVSLALAAWRSCPPLSRQGRACLH